MASAGPLGAQPGAASPAPAESALDTAVQSDIQALVQRAAGQAKDGNPSPAAPRPQRVEVQVGQLDPRLRLAPCQKIEPYWPAGQRVLGAARVGLRCLVGPKRWNVYLPVAIRLWGPGLAATGALPAGTLLSASHLRPTEVDYAARPDAVVSDPGWAVGRTLARALAEGQALYAPDLRLRQWVRAGDVVRVVAAQGSFQVTGEAQALTGALEGQPVRARTEGGRILQGVATAERQITVPL